MIVKVSKVRLSIILFNRKKFKRHMLSIAIEDHLLVGHRVSPVNIWDCCKTVPSTLNLRHFIKVFVEIQFNKICVQSISLDRTPRLT